MTIALDDIRDVNLVFLFSITTRSRIITPTSHIDDYDEYQRYLASRFIISISACSALREKLEIIRNVANDYIGDLRL